MATLIVLAGLIVSWAQGQTSLSINNPSFESPVLADGSSDASPDDWTEVGNLTGWTRNPQDGQISGTTGLPGTMPGTGDGTQCFDLWNGNAIEQTLGDTLTQGFYVLKVAVGHQNGQWGDAGNRFRIGLTLLAGTNELENTRIDWDYAIQEGSFDDVSLTYEATAGSPGLGEALKIRVDGYNNYAYVDNFRLDYYATAPAGTTWYVAPPPAGDDANGGTGWGDAFATIQRGVDAADVFDTVLVSNGTYSVSNAIEVLRDVTVRGDSGNPADVIVTLQPAYTSRVFYVAAPCAVVSGLTITNGLGGITRPNGVFILGYGGGVWLAKGTLTNCVVTGNSVKDKVSNLHGGGAYMLNGVITDCVFSNNNERVALSLNYAPLGGAIAAAAGVIRRCTIGPNNYARTGALYLTGGRVEACVIRNNTEGGIRIQGAVTVESSTIVSNASPSGVYVQTGPAVIRNSTISYNSVRGIDAAGQSLIENCVVSYNGTAVLGGGININAGANTTIRGCLVIGNEMYDTTGGAGISAVAGGPVMIENCTVVGNNARGNGSVNTCVGGVYAPSGTVLRNTIVRGNRVQTFDGSDVHNLFFTGAAVSNNCAPELTHGVDGNITSDPSFVAAGSGFGTSYTGYDLHLAKGSTCIDAGQYQTWMATAVDLDGAGRYNGTPVDMGAYEFPPPAGTVIMLR